MPRKRKLKGGGALYTDGNDIVKFSIELNGVYYVLDKKGFQIESDGKSIDDDKKLSNTKENIISELEEKHITDIENWITDTDNTYSDYFLTDIIDFAPIKTNETILLDGFVFNFYNILRNIQVSEKLNNPSTGKNLSVQAVASINLKLEQLSATELNNKTINRDLILKTINTFLQSQSKTPRQPRQPRLLLPPSADLQPRRSSVRSRQHTDYGLLQNDSRILSRSSHQRVADSQLRLSPSRQPILSQSRTHHQSRPSSAMPMPLQFIRDLVRNSSRRVLHSRQDQSTTPTPSRRSPLIPSDQIPSRRPMSSNQINWMHRGGNKLILKNKKTCKPNTIKTKQYKSPSKKTAQQKTAKK